MSNIAGKLLSAAAMATLLLHQSPAAKPQSTKPNSSNEASSASNPAEALRLNNLGTAYMGQQKFEQALKLFERAAALDPKLHTARLNLGIANLYLQRFDPARAAFQHVIARDPQNARAWYNLGLLYKNQGDAKASAEAFEHATQLAPKDPDAFYFLGTVHSQLGQDQQAIAAYRRALELNYYHASAEFGMARAYQHAGDTKQSREHLARFQQLVQSKLGAPISLAYGDQGALSLAVQATSAAQAVAPPIGVTFRAVTDKAVFPAIAPKIPAISEAQQAMLGPSACVLDYDDDGAPDLFLAAGGPGGDLALLHNIAQGKLQDVTKAAGFDSAATALSCAAADYDNDGHIDLAIGFADRVELWRNTGKGAFTLVKEALAGATQLSAPALTWVDYDHDGDADLIVISRPLAASESAARQSIFIFRNNGNGAFTEAAAELGMSAISDAIAAVPTDYNNDRAIDLVFTGGKTQLLPNPREGKWSAASAWPSDAPTNTVDVSVLDFNKDGWMDLAFTHSGSPGLSLWRNVEGKRFEHVALPDLGWRRGFGVVALDYDNDGWIDVAAVGENAAGHAELRLLRNEGPRGFRDVSTAVGLDKVGLKSPRSLVAADFDSDGDTDLLIAQNSAPPLLLRNDGANKNASLRITLRGLNDNKSAIGTKVEVFAGDLWQKWEVNGGQSSLDILAGLGQRKQVDVVRLLWPTGVLQDEAEIVAGKTERITEIDRRGSSCPVLFAWDGRRYRFVSDMIGAGVMGHWVAPGELNVPDPKEYVKLEGFQPAARHGLMSFRLMEPMEETVYLDQVRLLAVDHPREVDVYTNDHFAAAPPFPQFKIVTVRSPQPVAEALDDRRRDVTALLQARDHHYVADFELLPFKGFTRMHSLELDLGEPYRSGRLRLLLYGYIEYFTATGMYAAHQAGIEPVSPFVEALGPDGHWKKVIDDIGFPAGLPRSMVADLTGKLPEGTRRIRISTNLQIYWDQIVVDRSAQDASVRVHEVPLSSAKLAIHGYPRAIEGRTPGDLTYIYEDVSPTGPYTRQVGAYTRLGDVRNLLKSVDDRFAVFGSGDEVQLDFDPASLPPIHAGWTRDWLFFADGYEKDMDFYASNFLTVAPLPFHSMGAYPGSADLYLGDEERVRSLVEYNTRFFSGRPETLEYRFRFTSSATK